MTHTTTLYDRDADIAQHTPQGEVITKREKYGAAGKYGWRERYGTCRECESDNIRERHLNAVWRADIRKYESPSGKLYPASTYTAWLQCETCGCIQ